MTQTSRSSSEKRRFPRVRFHKPILLHEVVESKSKNVFEVKVKPVKAKAENISEGGLCVEMKDVFSPPKILKLNFRVLKNKTIDVYTKVVWTAKNHCGLQFIVLDETAREFIRGYVAKKA